MIVTWPLGLKDLERIGCVEHHLRHAVGQTQHRRRRGRLSPLAWPRHRQPVARRRRFAYSGFNTIGVAGGGASLGSAPRPPPIGTQAPLMLRAALDWRVRTRDKRHEQRGRQRQSEYPSSCLLDQAREAAVVPGPTPAGPPLPSTRPSGNVIRVSRLPGSPFFSGLTTAETLSPFLTLLNFQPPRCRMLGLPSSMLQCFAPFDRFGEVQLDVDVGIGPLDARHHACRS